MARTYTVKYGDCLWNIAKSELGDPLKWTYIADINGISRSYPLIHPGDVLKLDEDDGQGGTKPVPEPPDASTTSTPVIQYFGLQAGTDKTIFATWTWSRENTENYQVKWYYDTGQDIWFVGSDSSTEEKQAVYTGPSNALRVKCKVKAISKKHTVNDKETAYWTCGWSSEKIYDYSNNPPAQPSAPSVVIDKFKLTARLDNISDKNTQKVQFEVVKDDKAVFSTGTASVNTQSAAYSCTVQAGGSYKVRCRGGKNNTFGDWSEYSGAVETIPTTPSGWLECRANSETSVYLQWSLEKTAKTYELEYASEKDDFDITSDTTAISGIEQPYYEVTGLESGDEYFFRVRAVNEQGESGWSVIISAVVGKKPSAPTTWSSTTTAVVGEILTLYWVHNSEDGSKQSYAEVEITANGKKETQTIRTPDQPEDEEEKTYSYAVNTAAYKEGSKIEWRVRTAGITKQYGDWSVMRTIDVYAPPTLTLKVTDSSGTPIETLKSFPFKVEALAGPNTQEPIGYHLTISANESYETVDSVGNFKMVNRGEEVYSKHFDINRALEVQLTASDLDLENNIEYTLTVVVSMNSGLTCTQSKTFRVAWTDIKYVPNAELAYDRAAYAMYIRPFCEDMHNEMVEDVLMSVYRREYDGSFTELASGIDNNKVTFVTDPHPALDYARYRIIAITKDTGAVSYYDLPGYPVQEKAVIIQWNEFWSNFDTTSEDAVASPPWSGSLIRLPYNIDISDNNEIDAELVEYIGRKHPVSYYGTQLGTKASWSMEIPKSDKETLYALRRLAIWTGDVYVREPSGSGYWAHVSVSFSQTHCELTIPITLDITRVEGGA